MVGIAELVIIIGIIIGLSFAFRMIRFSQRVQARPKEKPATLDRDALQDAELQSYLPSYKIQAIRRYRELTGCDLKTAKESIEYIIAHPESLVKGSPNLARLVDNDGAGIKDLIAEGRIDEAVDIYAAFMGVDEFTARDAVQRMRAGME